MPSGCTPLATSTGVDHLSASRRDTQMPTSGLRSCGAAEPRGDQSFLRLDDRRGVGRGKGRSFEHEFGLDDGRRDSLRMVGWNSNRRQRDERVTVETQ